MSLALNGSSAIWHFKHSDVIEIHDGITFGFYTELPHIVHLSLLCSGGQVADSVHYNVYSLINPRVSFYSIIRSVVAICFNARLTTMLQLIGY